VPTCDNVLPLHHSIDLRLDVNAHILQRQDPEWLLDLHADLIYSSNRNSDDGGDGGPGWTI
jgi:hypothetical protein